MPYSYFYRGIYKQGGVVLSGYAYGRKAYKRPACLCADY